MTNRHSVDGIAPHFESRGKEMSEWQGWAHRMDIAGREYLSGLQ